MTTDKQLLKSRFSARLRDYDSLAVVQDAICGQLAEMTGRNCTRPVDSALEIGSGTGFLTRRLLELYPRALWTINDLVEQSADFLEPYAAGHDVRYLWGDAETIALPDRLDLIASASAVQWFDDLPRFARKAKDLLETGGYIVLSTFGPENFREIKAVTDEGLDYYTREQLQELFESAGFLTLETLEYTRSLAFDTPLDVLRHIRATGVNSIRHARWTKRELSDFETRYRNGFRNAEGQVTLTYHPVLLIAEKL